MSSTINDVAKLAGVSRQTVLLPMPLTYIDATFEDLGTLSAEYMLQTISEPEKKHVMQKKLNPELIVGVTCARIAVPV